MTEEATRIKCPECNADVGTTADACPQCGKRTMKKRGLRPGANGLLVLITVAVLMIWHRQN